jgi:hydantoinase/carbamoylase family amidase
MGVVERLELLYAIGDGEGANRPGLSAAEEEAHRLVGGWMQEAGLTVSRDRAGNLYGRVAGRDPTLPEVWIGSHLDSVPLGGRYDGALGVVAALEAVASLTERPERTIAVVAFRDEEGWRFGHGFLGSRAVSGGVDAAALDRRDRAGVSVRDALAELGLGFEPGASWLVPAPGAFVELHIEQGPVLAGMGVAVGVVDSIVGIVELEIVFQGVGGHAGTTPMDGRRDAALCAATFQVAAAQVARGIPAAVVTVGSIAVEPGAGNVVPRRARLVVDARAPDAARVAELEEGIRNAAARAAGEHGCSLEVTAAAHVAPVRCDPLVVEVLGRAAQSAPHLASGAGHDAQILGAAGVPVGMLFVRSLAGGISHSPLEDTTKADIAVAVGVLKRALPELCTRLAEASR